MVSQLGGLLLNIYFNRNAEYYNVVMVINFLLYHRIFMSLSKDALYRTRIHVVFTISSVIICYLLIRYFELGFITKALSVLNIAVVLYSFLFFYEMLQAPSEKSIYQEGKFWISAGFLIHHLSVFSFWLSYEFVAMLENQTWIMPLTYSLTILLYFILLIAIVTGLKFNSDD